MSNNLVTEKLTSLQIERHTLSGICKFPEVLYELNYLDIDSFSNNLHQTIFSILKQEILAGNSFDRVTLGQKVKGLLISFKDEVDPFLYVSNLFDSQINKKGTLNAARELVKLKVLRNIYNDTLEKQKFLISQEPSKMTLAEIINHVDEIDNKRINELNSEDEPVNLFDNIENIVNERALNPVEEIGIKTGYKLFDEMFGGLRIGISAFCGRAKHAKSTFLSNLAWGAILNNEDLYAIYIDTELKSDIQQFRSVAAFSQVPQWYIESGQFIKNLELTGKINNSWPILKKLKNRLYHYYVQIVFHFRS